ncbi:hypothetical protein [Actinokineospora iranica]|uniref:Uncharacterized protein n=1 Tax=Actinokineospora iranica TaxID=1271860 RepID=A0A1G6YD89_9PSEU|nr:hypothetical protein [Actinokineospora iranica]SDD88338.1 hypothetical protein SAMN05216174_12124 [Actinokineospora iranica]
MNQPFLPCPHGFIPQSLENICTDIDDLTFLMQKIKRAVEEVECTEELVDELRMTNDMILDHLDWIAKHTPPKK